VSSVEQMCETVRGLGYDPENLNNAQISKIVSEFVRDVEGANALPPSDGAIARREENLPDASSGGVPATGRSRRGRQAKQAPDISESIARAAGQADADMQSAISPIMAGIDQWTDYQAASVAQVIKDAPVTFLEKLGTELEEHRANPDGFRQLGEQFAAGIFGLIPNDEAS